MRSFIDGYAQIVAPLTDLTCKQAMFPMGEQTIEAFQKIKLAIVSTAIMALPDTTKPFVVRIDASDIVTGGVLQQEGKNIAFISRKLQGAERNYSVHDKEMLDVIHALKAWRQYLYGSSFTVVVDHQSLTHFFKQPLLNPRQRRWSEYLAEFDIAIQY